jgi:hypothetical protein
MSYGPARALNSSTRAVAGAAARVVWVWVILVEAGWRW